MQKLNLFTNALKIELTAARTEKSTQNDDSQSFSLDILELRKKLKQQALEKLQKPEESNSEKANKLLESSELD